MLKTSRCVAIKVGDRMITRLGPSIPNMILCSASESHIFNDLDRLQLSA